MTNNFWRTSYSYMNYEMRDYAVGLVDSAGRIITQSRLTHPAFTADLGFVVSAALKELGSEGIDDGDVIVSNDPVAQGQHLNNVVVFAPLVLDGKPLAYACVRAHWQDVGGGAIGSGATNSTEIFQEGIQLNAIKVRRKALPDKGASQAIVEVLGGQVQAMFGVSTLMPHIKSGKLRALATTGLRRTPAMPQLPTIAELGFPGFEAVAWYGFLAPARTPPAIIARVHDETVRALKVPDLKARLEAAGFDLVGSTPEAFAAYIKTEIKKWAPVIKTSGTQVD